MRFVMTYLVSKIMQAEGKFRRFLREEEGASAIEYAIVAGLLAGVLILAIGTSTTGLGGSISGLFSGIGDALDNAIPENTDG